MLDAPFDTAMLVRCLRRSIVAKSITADCFLLVMTCHQSQPAQFRNNELMKATGFGSKQRLVNARKQAIDARWIKYKPANKVNPGEYIVEIPAHIRLLDLVTRNRDTNFLVAQSDYDQTC